MAGIRYLFVFGLLLVTLSVSGQTAAFIGTSEEFILENVKDYESVQQRSIEHEEFDVLVFGDKNRELSFYFTFYKGAKVCAYIKHDAPLPALKEEIDSIKSSMIQVKDNIWQSADKSVQAEIAGSQDRALI